MAGWGKDEKTWRKFERVVAALHKLRDEGADVKWNEEIEGRQIDVTVRFERGGYKYLLLVECKNYSEAVPVKEVEAFITKASDLGANKAVMVAANGFQSGAQTVAARHHVDLCTLEQIDEQWPDRTITTKEPGIQLYDVELVFASGVHDRLVNNHDVIAQLKFDPPNWKPGLSLADISRHQPSLTLENLARSEPQGFETNFPSGCAVRHPKYGETPVQIRAVRFTAKRAAVPVVSRVNPPDVPLTSYVFTNLSSGDTFKCDGAAMPLGLDTQFRVGAFYRNIFGNAFKCEKLNDDSTAQMFAMLNQHGRKLGARVVMQCTYAPQYVEVTDAVELSELETEYRTYPVE
jgi:hypothetical protein